MTVTPVSPQYFQRVIPHQFDSCPDKLVLKAYQVKYNPKKMKRSVPGNGDPAREALPNPGEAGTVTVCSVPTGWRRSTQL